VTELLENTSMMDLIKNSLTGKLDEHEAKPLFKELIVAVHCLHEQNILHRDIKLENILVTKERHVKLIDLGFSIESTAKLNIFCGTPSYIAPEIIQKKGYFGKPADVWSCGIVLYKMLCGVFPFKGLNEKTLYSKISKGVFRFTTDVSMNAQILINRMLTSDPTARATIDELLREPWMLDKP
jgi:serine/threonine protein kinase